MNLIIDIGGTRGRWYVVDKSIVSSYESSNFATVARPIPLFAPVINIRFIYSLELKLIVYFLCLFHYPYFLRYFSVSLRDSGKASNSSSVIV